jgi:sodium/proline symporter
MILYSFIGFLVLFIIVGLLSKYKQKGNVEDYVLASRSTSPYLLGLSTFATNNSGFMFTALIGYIYMVGLSAIWITVPWILGDMLASYLFMSKIYKLSLKNDSLTYLDILTKFNNNNYKYFRLMGAILIVLFLSLQASAQLKATSYAFNAILGWEIYAGAIVAAIIILVYSFAGGIRASIWTDLVQSLIMFVSMVILLVVCVNALGGFANFFKDLNAISGDYMDFFPDNMRFGKFFGPILLVMGFAFGGAGFLGQPHLVIRFMAMRKVGDINKVRASYYGGYAVFATIVFMVGFAIKLLMPDISNISKEFLLFSVANNMLPEILVGIILAGLFSAAVSSIDSQVLSSSSSIVNDLKIFRGNNIYLYNKLATAFVIILALILSLVNSDTIFNIVFDAWAVLTVMFVPLIILLALDHHFSEKLAFFMSIGGFIAVLIWHFFGYPQDIYDVVIGLIVSFLIYVNFKNNKYFK